MTTSQLTRAILIETRDGVKKVEGIPGNAKITYGPVNPGKNTGYHDQNCLRIYTAQSNQLAVFLNVVSFRDLSLTVWDQETQTDDESTLISSPHGSEHSMTSSTETRWVLAG